LRKSKISKAHNATSHKRDYAGVMSPILTHQQRIHSAANDNQTGDQFARREHILHPDVQLDADDVYVSHQT
jgi:hypothetical protein